LKEGFFERQTKWKTMSGNLIIPEKTITDKIYIIRNQKVMLDRDLAALYGVETSVLN
jgi:hypothetical protein